MRKRIDNQIGLFGLQAPHAESVKPRRKWLGKKVDVQLPEWTSHQRRIFDWIASGSGNAAVKSVAGSGKTTTLVECINRTPDGSKVLALAFNTSAAKTLQKRLVRGDACTIHSYLRKQIQCAYPDCRLNTKADKLKALIDRVLKPGERGDGRNFIEKAKNLGLGVLLEDCLETWDAIARRYELNRILAPRMGEILREDVRDIERELSGFTDMLYLPLLKPDMPFEQFDWVFLDEGQDLNPAMLALLPRMLKPTGRFVAYGDPAQAIYGFRGSDADAWIHLIERFHCEELPLTVSFRCARSIVERAQHLVDYIEPAETADEGTVEDLRDLPMQELRPGDAILCRSNAPLFTCALQLLKMGIPAKLKRGQQDFQKELEYHIDSIVLQMEREPVDSRSSFLRALTADRDRQMAWAREQEHYEKLDLIVDRHEVIVALWQSLGPAASPDGIKQQLKKLYSRQREQIELSTIHSAKGLEWERVFILTPHKLRSYWTKDYKRWMLKRGDISQEANVEYVGVTRAKSELYFVWGDEPIRGLKDAHSLMEEEWGEGDDNDTGPDDEWL